jgi:hypothetical protein
MHGFAQLLGIGLAAVIGGLWLWVAGFNWSVVLRSLRRPAVKPPSLILLAGPLLVVISLQAVRLAFPASFGAAALPLVGLGLALDPGALPLMVVAAVRRLRGSRSLP